MDYAKPSTDANGKPSFRILNTNVPGSLMDQMITMRGSQQVCGRWFLPPAKECFFAYSFPNSYVNTKVIKGVRATIGAQNLFTITNYTGYDPEVGAYVGRDAGS